jgi:superfamily I DNA/RNA helicase
MSKQSHTHAVRAAIRKAFSVVAQGGDDNKVEPGYFVDLVVFMLALDAYTKLKGDADPHTAEATKLLRRYQGEVVEGVQQLMLPLTTKSAYSRFRAPVGLASRSTRGLGQAREQARVLAEMFSVLRTHSDDLKETFSDTRAAATAQKVANLAASESPETVLNGLATVPPASRLRMTRDWVKDAAKLAGVAPSNTEATLADAEVAKNIGEDIRAVEAKLNIVDPVSADAADLQGQKQELLSRLDAVVETSENPTVVLSAAASAASQDKVYATKVGKAQRLSPDQERAMMVRGKGIIAAGAGSGKTKTLAAKVVYHIDELGVSPRSIMATSFSRKSAAELRKRIEDYGASFGNGEDTGLGTTHSIAAKLMREYGSGGREGLKPYEQTNLVRLAMKQAEMKGAGSPPPPPTSLLSAPGATPSSTAPDARGGGLTFSQALAQAERNVSKIYSSFLRGVVQGFRDPSAEYYGYRRKHTNNFTDPRGLTDKNRAIIFDAFRAAGVNYDVRTDPINSGARVAAKAPRDKDKGLREKYPSFSTSANQWFNMGLSLTDDGTEKGEPLPPGHFKQAITKYKGRMVSPSEAYHLAKSGQLPDGLGLAEAAVYAAYEYLKGPNGETDFAGKGDFDDVLIDVSKMLLANPRALSSAQARFKVILVDEAQDLNRCVSGDTEVQTPNGPVAIRDVEVGTQVLSYENGEVVYNQVLNKTRSSWARGYRIHLTSGDTLLMSPDHRIYATPVTCEDGQMALYLMYRKDMGFRIGTTRDLSKRAPQEHADCAWVLEIGEDAEMLYKEQAFSLKYGVPTYIFEGSMRGCDQPRIDRLFQEFGENGRGILAEYDLHFEYPHWVASAVDRGRFTRRVVNFCPHRSKGKNSQKGSSVSMNWTAGDFDFGADVPTYTIKGGRKMVGILTSDYAKGRSIAQAVAEKSGAYLVESLPLGDESLPLITASGLFPGMRVPVWVGGVSTRNEDLLGVDAYRALAQEYGVSTDDLAGRNVMGKRLVHERIRHAQVLAGCAEPLPAIEEGVVQTVEIESVEVVSEGDFWDIAVENAHNFFGNRILSHNCQHMMFGLLAGYVDPAKANKVATAKKIGELAKDNGSMTADTYCFIGDDAQAIYEFRGADPEAFIDMSDLVAGGAGFKTELLHTNYRSGELIVQAANRLIAYNKKQIPKTCAANPSRGDKGGITRVPFPPVEGKDMSEPAAWLASRVEEMMELGEAGKKGYDAFGVGLRSNAEAYTYGVELLKKGIPFRAKANFFGDTNTKALLNWLTIADEGVDGDVSRINDAVLNARTAPTSMLGQKFVDTLTEQATGNYLVWLQQNYASIYGPRAFQTASVKAYVDNLTTVANLKNAGLSNETLLDAILGLQGVDGSTVMDALVDKVRNDDEAMAELRAANPSGEVTDEAVLEQATAPIAPLKGLLDARANVTEAMKYVRTLQAANAKLAANDDPEAKGFNEPAVTLGTMHSWKGLEVANMFVPVVGGKFPRTDATEDDLASERRLAYVALTRGENNVFVMDIPTVRRTKQGTVVLKSQFIDEMCLPTSAPAKTASTRYSSVLPNGRSVFDPEVMDAYLRGEDPALLPASMGGAAMPGPLWDDTLYAGE